MGEKRGWHVPMAGITGSSYQVLVLLRDDHIIMFISRYHYLKISGLDIRKDRSYFLSPQALRTSFFLMSNAVCL